jgi:hypothetical protein
MVEVIGSIGVVTALLVSVGSASIVASRHLADRSRVVAPFAYLFERTS